MLFSAVIPKERFLPCPESNLTIPRSRFLDRMLLERSGAQRRKVTVASNHRRDHYRPPFREAPIKFCSIAKLLSQVITILYFLLSSSFRRSHA